MSEREIAPTVDARGTTVGEGKTIEFKFYMKTSQAVPGFIIKKFYAHMMEAVMKGLEKFKLLDYIEYWDCKTNEYADEQQETAGP